MKLIQSVAPTTDPIALADMKSFLRVLHTDDDALITSYIKAACEKAAQPLTLRMQTGYDHSYHFIASFIGEHIAYHAKALKA